MGLAYPDRPLSLTWQPEYRSDNCRIKSLPQTLLSELELEKEPLPETPLGEPQNDTYATGPPRIEFLEISLLR